MTMRISADARDAWRPYGGAAGRFFAFVAAEPSAAGTAAADLARHNPLPSYTLHPWPALLDGAVATALEARFVALDALLRDVPRRFFDSDPGRMAAFYGRGVPDLAQPAAIAVVMAPPDGVAAAVARLDVVPTADGPRCLEYNAGSLVGGWESGLLPPYLASRAPLADFLAADGSRAVQRPILRPLLRHLAGCAVDSGVWDGGALNTALLVHPHKPQEIALHSAERYQRAYDEALAALDPALSGRLLLCGWADVDLTAPRPRHRASGTTVHAAFENYDGLPDRAAFRLAKAGRLQLFSGPVTVFLSDKRNLALLSSAADEGDGRLDGEEGRLVRQLLPTTRLVDDGETTWDGEAVHPSELLRRRRDELVLKKGVGLGGHQVAVGRFTSAHAWAARVDEALAAPGTWIVQRYVESIPHLGPPAGGDDDDGAAITPSRFDAVWGPFVFAGGWHGTFLRLQERGAGGVINTSSGARVGAVVEVEGGGVGHGRATAL